MKAVLLQRRAGNRVVLTHFATRQLAEEPHTVESLSANLRALLNEMGGTAKACGISVSNAASFVRILEQPEIPTELLRDALRLNGQMLLNQDCRELVLDCDTIPSSEPVSAGVAAPAVRYVVGGLPRTQVQQIHDACVKAKVATTALQVAPVALFNGFEFSNEETFNSQAFVLVDIGHVSSTVVVGAKKELVLVRTLEFGGLSFADELICHGAASFEEVLELLGQEEVLTVENARHSLTELVRSISSSIGYFEARREEVIPRVFVSGGLVKSAAILKILTEELQLPCEAWNPFAKCEINVSPARKNELPGQWPVLGVAYGAAAELLKGR